MYRPPIGLSKLLFENVEAVQFII